MITLCLKLPSVELCLTCLKQKGMALLFRLNSLNHVTTTGSNAQNTILGHSGICWCVVYQMPLADTSNKMTKDSILYATYIGSNMIERVPGLTVVG